MQTGVCNRNINGKKGVKFSINYIWNLVYIITASFLSKERKNLVKSLGVLSFKCDIYFGPHCVTPVSCCSMSTSFVIMTKKLQEMVENEHIFQLVIIFMDHSTFSEVFATTYLLLPIPFLLLLHNAAKLFLILLKFRNSGKATKFCKNIFQFLLLLKIT